MAPEATASTTKPEAHPRARLDSLDALRGFVMFWIVGAEGMVHALRKISDSGWIAFLSRQLDHERWEGLSFYDLVFPLFLFIVGISIVLSLAGARDGPGRAALFRRIFQRGLLLYLLGVFCSGGVSRGWEGVRLMGVLPRIAICYVVAACLFCTLRLRGLLVTCGALLIGYWALMTFVPIRNISVQPERLAQLQQQTATPDARALFDGTGAWVRGKFEPGLNLANHLDFKHLPGRKWDGTYDPEGLLSTLPAIATCLLGVFVGLLLRDQRFSDRRKVTWLVAGGIGGIVLGFLWGLQFPVIKQLWTSSFVLVAGGWSCLLLAVFYLLIEIRQHRRWATPFFWIGTNAIVIYVADALFDFQSLAKRLVGGPIQGALGSFGQLLVTAVALALIVSLVRFLYRRRIFVRL